MQLISRSTSGLFGFTCDLFCTLSQPTYGNQTGPNLSVPLPNLKYFIVTCRYIQSTCATTGEGLYEGLDWLSNNIANKVLISFPCATMTLCETSSFNLQQIGLCLWSGTNMHVV
jgi:hypothetical protein